MYDGMHGIYTHQKYLTLCVCMRMSTLLQLIVFENISMGLKNIYL